jgi:hypothetical protein
MAEYISFSNLLARFFQDGLQPREYAMSSRSISSSSWTPTITATGLPFRVTTTGPASLAFRKALNRDLLPGAI